MKWFGPFWYAPVCESNARTETPKEPCLVCEIAFVEGDQGLVLPYIGGPDAPPEVAYHKHCFLQSLGIPLTVHVLHEGQPLCDFDRRLPGQWDEPHRWVRLKEWRQATCPGCRTIAADGPSADIKLKNLHHSPLNPRRK